MNHFIPKLRSVYYFLITIFCVFVIVNFYSVINYTNRNYPETKLYESPKINLIVNTGVFNPTTKAWQSSQLNRYENLDCQQIKARIPTNLKQTGPEDLKYLGVVDYRDLLFNKYSQKNLDSTIPESLRYCQQAHYLAKNWDQACQDTLENDILLEKNQQQNEFKCYSLGKGFMGNKNPVTIYQYRYFVEKKDLVSPELNLNLPAYNSEILAEITNSNRLLLTTNYSIYRNQDDGNYSQWELLNSPKNQWNIYAL